MNKRERELRSLFEEEVTVLAVARPHRTTHAKLHCEYHGHTFYYVTSLTGVPADRRRAQNQRADLRRIKRAIDNQDVEVLGKFKVRRAK